MTDRAATRPGIPWRAIWATLGSIAAAAAAVILVVELRRLIFWLVIAGFFALALNPAVDVLVRRFRMRRGVATTIVVLAGVLVLAGIVTLFVRPLVEQGSRFADDLPRYVEDAQRGRGPVGELLDRVGLDDRLRDQSSELRSNIAGLGGRSLAVLGAIGSAAISTVTILVLTFMLLLEGDRILAGALALVPERHREHVARVAADCGRAVTGYVTGNLVISCIAGGSSFIMLLSTGTPFAGLLALWVGLTDLIPLVGATLGAVVVVVVAFIASPTAGIVALIFFVLYQQLENHVLQPAVQARTVRLNALTVLVAALAGVELAGLLGALLAIPVAGMLTVILRDLSAGMRPELEGVTIGEDHVPVEHVEEPAPFVDRDDEGRLVTAQDRADVLDDPVPDRPAEGRPEEPSTRVHGGPTTG